MSILQRSFGFAASALILFFAPALQAQVHPTEDSRGSRSAYLTILADVDFSVKYAEVPFRQSYSMNGAGQVTQQQLENDLKSQYEGFLAYMILQEYPVLVNTFFVGSYLSQIASQFNPYLAAFAYAQVLYNIWVVEGHVRENGYVFVVPADGWYNLRVWVPGDWDKPCSMIKVTSTTASGSSQVYNYDKTNVSDRTETIRLYLRRGSAMVKVSVGSGTLNFHNAGHMEGVCMDNPAPVSWTEKAVPVNVQPVNLLEHLPYVGATWTGSVTYVPRQDLLNGVVGSVRFSNPQAAFMNDPLPPARTTELIDIWGQATPEQQQQLGTWKYINLDCALLSSPVFDGQTGFFTLRRTADFLSTVIVKGRFHLTMEQP